MGLAEHAAKAGVALVSAPLIASSVVSGVRRTLIVNGLWDDVRRQAIARDARVLEWIDTPLSSPWSPVEKHLAVMEAIAASLGDEGARAFGRTRLREGLEGGVLAPVLRSWMRSYGSAPAHLMRVAPHMWRAVTRGLGRLVVLEAGERSVTVRVLEMPEQARRCAAWHRFLEGYGVALLEACAYTGSVQISVSPVPGELDARVAW
jgi:hypothetical protein